MPWLRRKAGDRGDGIKPPQDVYAGLRWTALSSGRNGSLPRHDAHPDVYGLVTDLAQGGDWITIAALADNTTSMYTSTGGGVIGAGFHAAVAAATQRLLAAVQAQLPAFDTADDGGYPAYGTVRLHLLTGAAGRYTDVPDEAFRGRAAHPLRPVLAAAQDVLTGLREADTRQHEADSR